MLQFIKPHSMNKEQLNEMIKLQGIYEIIYKKEQEERTWHISDIEKHDNNCIRAYCHEIRKDLVFSIRKIVSVNRYWIDILYEEEKAPISGIYLFVCRGDNHLIAELYRLEQGEKLYKYFEGEYHHMNGWFEVIPLAYHYVEGFAPNMSDSKWRGLPEEIDYLDHDYIRIGVAKTDTPLTALADVASGDNNLQYYLLDTMDVFCPVVSFKPKGDEHTIPLGIYRVVQYTEMNHWIHWNLYALAHNSD